MFNYMICSKFFFLFFFFFLLTNVVVSLPNIGCCTVCVCVCVLINVSMSTQQCYVNSLDHPLIVIIMGRTTQDEVGLINLC